MIKLLTISMLLCANALAVGTVQQSLSRLGQSDVWVLAFNWTGDSVTGSVPMTAASIANCCQGYFVSQVVAQQKTPTPTNGYGFTLTDFSGYDIMGGVTANVYGTAAQSWAISTAAPPLNGTITLTISGQSVAGASGTLYVYLGKQNSITASSSVPSWISNLAGKPVFDVRSYGAKCDGSTDDTTPIQAAITAAQGIGGGAVYVVGTCKTGQVLITAAGVSIIGNGSEASILKANSAVTGAVVSVSAALGAFTISNIGIDGSASVNADCISLASTRRWEVSQVKLTGCRDGLQLNGTNSSNAAVWGNFTDSWILDWSRYGVYANANGAAENSFSNLQILRLNSGTSTAGFYITKTIPDDTGAYYLNNVKINRVTPGSMTNGFVFTSTVGTQAIIFANQLVCDNVDGGSPLLLNNGTIMKFVNSWFWTAANYPAISMTNGASADFISNDLGSAYSPVVDIVGTSSIINFVGGRITPPGGGYAFRVANPLTVSGLRLQSPLTQGTIGSNATATNLIAQASQSVTPITGMRVMVSPNGGYGSYLSLYNAYTTDERGWRMTGKNVEKMSTSNTIVGTEDDDGQLGASKFKGIGTAVTITSGFGTSPTISGADAAFRVTLGTTPGSSGVVALKQTYLVAPIVTCSDSTTNGVVVRAASTTTTATITQSVGTWLAGDLIECIVHVP